MAKRVTRDDTALVIRTVDQDMQAHGGFVWPASGPVECPDWNTTKACGHGFHGLLDGLGDYSLLSSLPTAKWLIVKVKRSECIEIGGKVKFPRGEVIYCGGVGGAFKLIAPEWIRVVTEAALRATSTVAKKAKQSAAALGKDGIAIVQGLRGTAMAGEHGTIILPWWDEQAKRHRISVGYIGEGGLKLKTVYRVDAKGTFKEVGAR